jgi:peptide/nickel transport system permease protein
VKKFFGIFRHIPVLPVIMIFLVIVCGIGGPYFAPHDPTEGDLLRSLTPPLKDTGYLLGTDQLGRDIFSRIICGARISLIVGVAVVAFAGTLGVLLAMLSGYLGGKVDMIIMRITDAMMSIPFLMLAVSLAAVLGPSLRNIIVLLSIMGWTGYARVLRAEVLRYKESDFVKLAQVDGCSKSRILLRHIFPNILNSLLILATLQVGSVITIEAALSFLGLGVPPPTPSWGGMLSDSRSYTSVWWMSLFPGLAIMFTVLSFNLLGDWLRLRLDPKFRQL